MCITPFVPLLIFIAVTIFPESRTKSKIMFSFHISLLISQTWGVCVCVCVFHGIDMFRDFPTSCFADLLKFELVDCFCVLRLRFKNFVRLSLSAVVSSVYHIRKDVMSLYCITGDGRFHHLVEILFTRLAHWKGAFLLCYKHSLE